MAMALIDTAKPNGRTRSEASESTGMLSTSMNFVGDGSA